MSNQAEKIEVKPGRWGKGVFALRNIAAGEIILRFQGGLTDAAAVRAMKDKAGNPLQIDDNLYIDLQAPGVFVNHSCDPNAGIKHDTELIALDDIAPGQEILFDYSTSMSRVVWSMRCECGNACCRNVIGDFRDLPEALKKRYLALNIVQHFIARDPSRW